jgi:hypothetical protein
VRDFGNEYLSRMSDARLLARIQELRVAYTATELALGKLVAEHKRRQETQSENQSQDSISTQDAPL